tara:strand:+ start:1355 stop:1501 length:147 start_codon:yes stop_codon:yes gene_type:complete
MEYTCYEVSLYSNEKVRRGKKGGKRETYLISFRKEKKEGSLWNQQATM